MLLPRWACSLPVLEMLANALFLVQAEAFIFWRYRKMYRQAYPACSRPQLGFAGCCGKALCVGVNLFL